MSDSESARLLQEAEAMLWRTRLHLCWVDGKHYWVAETPHETLLVDHEIYSRILKEELAKYGITCQTWSAYLEPAERAWMRQCAIEDELKSQIIFWKQVAGVEIWTPNHKKEKEEKACPIPQTHPESIPVRTL